MSRQCSTASWLVSAVEPRPMPIFHERKMLPTDWGDGYPNVWLGITGRGRGALPHALADPLAYSGRWFVSSAMSRQLRRSGQSTSIRPIACQIGSCLARAHAA
jgi:hypothetical protein